MKKLLLLSFFLMTNYNYIFGQVLGKLSYDNTPKTYVAPPSQRIRVVENSTQNNSIEVDCDDLINYVEINGNKKETVNAIQLINSSWLKEVNAYLIENVIIVVAEIKRDGYSIITKKYIFCAIPSSNWDNFYYGYYDIGKTYGEKFNKYIIDYECKCK